MSDTPQNQGAPQRQGFIARIVSLPFQLFGILCGALLLSIIIECVGMRFFWPDEGWHHASRMLDHELHQLSGQFTHSLLANEPGKAARALVDKAYTGLFVKSGLLDWMKRAAEQSRAPARDADADAKKDFRYYVSRLYLWLEDFLIASAFTVLVFCTRLIVLTLTLPLFLLAALTGLVDGLVRRDIRKFGAGRESGYLYHRARASIFPLLMLPWTLYLALPVSLHPLWILLPAAVLLSLAANLAAGSFKKYI
jgi:integrating conjugative element membrane protein (TIGR03747 family)